MAKIMYIKYAEWDYRNALTGEFVEAIRRYEVLYETGVQYNRRYGDSIPATWKKHLETAKKYVRIKPSNLVTEQNAVFYVTDEMYEDDRLRRFLKPMEE